MTTFTVQPVRRLRWISVIRVRWHGVVGIAAAVLALIVLATVFAPFIAPHNPNTVDLGATYSGPTARHLLGADSVGRDLLSRLLWGGRTALLAPLIIVALAGAVGTSVALLSSWCGGWVDFVLSRLFDVMFAFPGLLLAILATALFGAGLKTLTIALTIAYVPYIGRVVRSEAIRQRQLPYVAATSLQGFSGVRVAVRHLLPNIAPLVFAQLTLAYGYALLDAATLSYLGLGIQPPTSDWGLMVSTGQSGITSGHPQESLFAGGAIVLVVVAVTLVGSHLADRAERAL